MKLKFLAILITLVCISARAQSFEYPKIGGSKSSMKEFIPAGWSLKDSAKGDLNGDFRNDFVFVLQYNDSVKVLKNDLIAGSVIVITQPRILLIGFKYPETNLYYIKEQSNTFILNADNPSMEDPYQSVEITKGVIYISFQLFYNFGSYSLTNTTYKFRFQNDEFALIGVDNYSISRSTLDFEESSYNFLSKKWSLKRGNEENNTKAKAKSYPLEVKDLKTLKTFKQPYSWEIRKNIYL